MPIRAVVFDAVGTLIDAEPSVVSVYAAIGRRHGSVLDDGTIKSRFKAAFQRQDEIDRLRDWTTSEEREEQRWRDIVAEVFGVDACFADLYEHFARPDSWRVAVGTQELISILRRRGLVVAMASNFDARLFGIVKGLPELSELNDVIVSSAVGTRKPGRGFFDAVTRRLELPANEIAFVGDDLINDGKGAADAGMMSLLLGRDWSAIGDVERYFYGHV